MIFIHSKIKKIISAYLDNEVSEKEKNLVEEHLKKCTFCRKYYENLQRLSSALNKYKEEELSSDLEQRIKNNFLGGKYKGVAKMKNKKLIVGISSGALAILLMFVFVGHIQNSIQKRIHNAYLELSGEKQYESVSGGEEYSSSIGDGSVINSQYPQARKVEKWRDLNRSQGSLEDSKASRKSIYADSNKAWMATSGKYAAGYAGHDYAYQLNVPSESLIKPSITGVEEGPIVIVEPYLPATGKEDKLIRNAYATLEVENIQKVYDEIVKVGKGKNGYLAAANFNESTSGRVNAQIILRVPKEKFEETIDEIRKLGQVKRFDIHSIDVSQDYSSLVSELNTIKTVYDKIAEKLKEKKTDIQGAIRLESQLSPIAKRIEAIRSKIAEYDNLIAVSTITINLYEVSWKLMIQESLKETKQRFVAFVASLLKNSVTLLPLLAIVCVIGFVCVALAKKLISVVKKIFTKKSS
ncbi:MAG: DUF4349 domain-containing protein [Candidatus Omnitrophota bacterium]